MNPVLVAAIILVLLVALMVCFSIVLDLLMDRRCNINSARMKLLSIIEATEDRGLTEDEFKNPFKYLNKE